MRNQIKNTFDALYVEADVSKGVVEGREMGWNGLFMPIAIEKPKTR